MSASLVNRSVATIRTELDFLVDSGEISRNDYDRIIGILPSTNSRNNTGAANTTIPEQEVVEAIYPFRAQQAGDLEFMTGDIIEVLGKPSSNWYKGRCRGSIGLFPSNYVKPVTKEKPLQATPSPAPPQYQVVPQSTAQSNTTVNYTGSHLPSSAASYYQQSATSYSSYPVQYQQPPAPVQYVAPPAAPVAVAQPAPPPQAQPAASTGGAEQAFKKFGGKLGNAAIFGAGATMGSELVHTIF